MKNKALFFLVLILTLLSQAFPGCAPQPNANSPASSNKPVKVAVIGGMSITTPLWNEISKRFEAEAGIKIELIAMGEKAVLSDAFITGKADFLTMHSSDITTNLVADGYGAEMRPWAKNDLVIVGPASDPARISGLTSGIEAVKKIAESQSNYMELYSNGPRETSHTLFTKAGVEMVGPWVLKYENKQGESSSVLHYVASKKAYMIAGRIPIMFRKMEPDPDVKIMVQGDPMMQRPYIAMIANPEKFPEANVAGARRLSDFLISDETQKFLATYDGGIGDGIPIFIPVKKFPGISTSQTPAAAPSAPSQPATSTAVYSIAVFQNGKQVGTLSLADLQKLPFVKFTSEGRESNGPSLATALKSVGITDFSEVTIYGLNKGRVSPAELTLQKLQVNENVALSITNQGTTRLSGVDIPFDSWIIDVNKLAVK